MFDYLQQFNSLPANLREKVSSPAAMSSLNALEEKYKTGLATILMRLMIKNVAFSQLPKLLVFENGLEPKQAEALSQELLERILFDLKDYLGIAPISSENQLDKKIEELMQRADITFPSVEMAKRLRQLIFTYLKGIRNKIDARSALTRPYSQGGFGLSDSQADRIIQLSGEIVSGDMSADKPKPPSPLQKIIDTESTKLSSVIKGDSYDLKAAIAARAEKKIQPEPDKLIEEGKNPMETKLLESGLDKMLSASLSPLPAVVVPQVEPTVPTASAKPPVQDVKPAAKPVEVPVKPVADSPVVTAVIPPKPEPKIVADVKPVATPAKASVADLRGLASRYKIQDIKPAPIVMGPVDELRMLSVLNFRRLGETPGVRIDKIISKIRLLQKDGYEKMVSGVSAWRLSPANRLYLQIAKDALVQGLTLQQAAEARAKAGKETYSLEELEAIMTLNNRLMF